MWAECRKRYGQTFTARLPGFPPVVVTSDRDAIRRLFTGDPSLRRHGNDLFRPIFGDRSIMVLEPTEHLERRKIDLPPFHGKAIKSYSRRIQELCEQELVDWRLGEVVASHPRARALTLAIILELVLGVRDIELRDELAELIDWFNTPLHNLALFMPAGFNRRAWWNLPTRPAYARLDRMHLLLNEHIASTRRDEALDERTDVLALLVAARGEDGRALTDLDLRDELMTLVIAGHETTATTIAWACDLLAHNPEQQDRIRMALAGGDREYLKASAKEVLRARTIAYASAARHPLEPFPIGDWLVGPQTLILVDAQGVHGDPELYPDPEAFKPERFLENPPDGYAYIPFGGGTHRCLGGSLAMLELETFVEALAGHARLAPAGAPARQVRRGPILAPDTEGRVRVARLHPAQRRVTEAATSAPAGI
jgi:cytochrome P450